MQRLSHAIEALLYTSRSVVVPGLGTFYCTSQVASYQSEYKLVYATQRIIGFISSPKEEDAALVGYYASHLGLSLRRARTELERDVQRCRTLLLSQPVNFPRLGRLSLNAQGVFTLSREEGFCLSRRDYGLPSVCPFNHTMVLDRNRKPQTDLYHYEGKADYYQLNIAKRYVHQAGVSLLLLILLFLPFRVWDSQITDYRASFVPNRAYIAELIKQSKQQVETEREVEICTTMDTVQSALPTYHIIIGAELKSAVAEGYYQRYLDLFPNMTILKGNKLYRISAEQFDAEDRAQAYVNKLSREGISAWIYCTQ